MVATQRLILAAACRALWFSEVSLARKVIGNTAIGGELLCMEGTKVCCKNHVCAVMSCSNVPTTLFHRMRSMGLDQGQAAPNISTRTSRVDHV